MAMKQRGIEPTYALIIAQCPNASINPTTGEPVGKQVVYDILGNRCYDIDPDTPWSHQKRMAKVGMSNAFSRTPLMCSLAKKLVVNKCSKCYMLQEIIFIWICQCICRCNSLHRSS